MEQKRTTATAKQDRRQLMKLKAELFAALNSIDDEEPIKIDKVKEAIEKGADINCQLDGQTPLHVAVECQEASVVKILLELGANPKLKDDEGLTAIEIAADIGNPDVLACFPSIDLVPPKPICPIVIQDASSEKPTNLTSESVPKFKSLDKSYYISRILRHPVFIKNDVLDYLSTIDNRDESRNSVICDIRACNQEQFDLLLQENPDDNIHLLSSNKKGLLVWHKTRGCIDLIAQHVDFEKEFVYSAKRSDKLLDVADQQRIMLIVDQPGMGKSVIVTYMAHMIKRRSPLHWVSRIDFNDFCKDFNAYKNGEVDEDYVCRKIFKLDTPLEVYLFGKCLRQNKAVLMLDGFDEISPMYKEAVIKLLLYLKNTPVRQLWVTSRPHLERELVNVLEQLPIYLKPFTKANQIRFLTQFWKLKTFNYMFGQELNMRRIRMCAEVLIKKLKNLKDEDREFTGIPLLIRMMAEYYSEEIKKVENNSQDTLDLPKVLDLYVIFKKFITQKLDIHNQKGRSIGEERYAINAVNPLKVHQRLAIKLLFPEEHSFILGGKTTELLGVEALVRYGIVYGDGQNFRFTHRAFAEYLAAVYFEDRLRKNKQSEKVKKFFLRDILAKEDYRVIRRFFEDLLDTNQISYEVIQEYGKLLVTYWDQDDSSSLIETAVVFLPLAEANSNILDFLLKCLNSEDSNVVVEILSGNLTNGETCWEIAASHCFHKTISVILEWCKKMNLCIRDMLLKNVQHQHTVFHIGITLNSLDVVKMLCDWAERETMNIKQILDTNDNAENPLWHLISNKKRLKIFRVVTKIIEEKDEDTMNIFRLKNKWGNNLWHEIVARGNCEISSKFFQWYSKTTESIHFLMHDKNLAGWNVWHQAVVHGNLDSLRFLHEIAVNYHIPIDHILFSTDIQGNNVFHMAANYNKAETFRFMWKLVPNDETKKLVLTTKNFEDNVVWQVMQWSITDSMFRIVWECTVDTETLINEFMLFKEPNSDQFWSAMLGCSNPAFVDDVLTFAAEKNIDLNRLLKSKNSNGYMLLHRACFSQSDTSIQTLRNWFSSNSISFREMIMERDIFGGTPLHGVASRGNNRIFKLFLDWANIENENIIEFLSPVDIDGDTIWHLAAINGHQKLLQELFNVCREHGDANLIVESLMKMNKGGNTPWLCAASQGHVKVMTLIMKNSVGCIKILEQRNYLGKCAWHVCAMNRHDEALHVVLVWCLKAKLDMLQLASAKDPDGNTLFHLVAKGGCVKSMELLLLTFAKIGLDDIFTDRNNSGDTLLLCAVHERRIFELLWSWLSRTQLDPRDVLLAKNDLGYTAWHLAAHKLSTTRAFDYLWPCADEVHVPRESIWLDIDNAYRHSLFHILILADDLCAFEEVCHVLKATGVLTACLQDLVDINGDCILHIAARMRSSGFVGCIRDMLLSNGGNLRHFIMRRNKMERTVVHVSCESWCIHSLEEIGEWIEDPEFAGELIGAKDTFGDTALHVAMGGDKSLHVDAIVLWAFKVGYDLKELLTATNAAGDNVWFVGVRGGSAKALRALYKRAAEVSDMDLRMFIQLTRDAKGQSLLEIAMTNGAIAEIIQNWERGECVADEEVRKDAPGMCVI